MKLHELYCKDQIDSKYTQYMAGTFATDAKGQWNKCLAYCLKMKEEFPELTLKKGYVYSHQNIDNANPGFPRQYPHAWLTDPNGYIIDPTVLQFSLLGELIYVEADMEKLRYRCEGCGQHCEHRFCGKCPWSEPEPHQAFITDIQKLLVSLKFPTAHPTMSQEWKVTIHFRDGKPFEAEWIDFTEKEFSSKLVKISSPLKTWDHGFLHFYLEHQGQIIRTTELKLSEQYLMEKNLGEVITAPAISCMGTYPMGLALDNSDV